MGFFTIFVPDGLTEREYLRALRSGPSFVSSRRENHLSLLTSAGFEHIEETDVTDEFLETARAWYSWRERFEDDLVAAEGRAAFDEREQDSRTQIAAIEAGLLRRSLFVCARPLAAHGEGLEP